MNGDPAAQGRAWYLYRNEQRHGPYSLQILNEAAKGGQLFASDFLWHDGLTEWTPAGELLDEFTSPSKLNQTSKTADSSAGAANFGTIAAAIAICAALGGTLDLLQKIGPLTWIAIAISAAALLCVYWLYRRGKLLRQEWKNASVALGIILVGMICLKAAQLYTPNAETNGVLAAKIEAVADLQNAILAALGKIERDTRETAASIARVESAVENVKKETSSDPRKELANMGIAWTPEAFSNALAARDARAIDLFLRGGYVVTSYQITSFIESGFDKEIAALLGAHARLVDRAVCEKDTISMPTPPGGVRTQDDFIKSSMRDADKQKLYFSICDPRLLRSRYESKANEIRKSIAGHGAAMARRDGLYRTCVSELETKHLPKVQGLSSSEAMRAAGDVYVDARRRPLPNPLPADFERKFEPAMRNHAIFTLATFPNLSSKGMFAHVIEMGCQDAYPKPAPENPAKLENIQAILELIPGG